jgi:hypothetical protein
MPTASTASSMVLRTVRRANRAEAGVGAFILLTLAPSFERVCTLSDTASAAVCRQACGTMDR